MEFVVTIELKDGTAFWPRSQVAALSPVFKAMMEVNMRETIEGEIHLPHISNETWNCALDFTSDRNNSGITEDNVGDVIAFSHMYQMEALTDFCETFLINCLKEGNCLYFRKLADRYGWSETLQNIKMFIQHHFAEVCESDDFLTLGKEELSELLTNPYVTVMEANLCGRVMAWMETAQLDGDSFFDVFSLIKVDRLSSPFLTEEVLTNENIRNNTRVKENIEQVLMQRHLGGIMVPDQAIPCMRGAVFSSDDILVLGHMSGRLYFCRHSSQNNSWNCRPRPRMGKVYSASALVLGGNLILTGGKCSKLTYIFEVKTTTWTVGPNLNQGRSHHGMAAVAGRAYVVGGRNPRALTSIEGYSFGDEKWERIGNLSEAVDICGVATVGRKIVVLGSSYYSECDIQTFDVTTRTSVVLQVELPFFLHSKICCVSSDDLAIIVREGGLCQISTNGDSLKVSESVRLHGISYKDTICGAFFDGCRLLVFGNKGRGRGNFVKCFSLTGETMDAETGPLPERMNIWRVLSSPKR